MKQTSIGLIAVAFAALAFMTISLSSCENSDMPTVANSSGGTGHGKGPRVLGDNCKTSVEITDCPNGGVTLEYNDDGDLVANGLDGAASNTIDCNFGSAINVWRAAIDVEFPETGGSLTYEAKDANGNTEASADFKYNNGAYEVNPTFTSAADAGDPQYDAVVYDGATEVGRANALDPNKPIRVLTQDCVVRIFSIGWDVYQVNAQCAFTFGLDPCCKYTFELPDRTKLDGNRIKLIERNSRGVYVYLQTSTITTSGKVANYAIKSASAYSN